VKLSVTLSGSKEGRDKLASYTDRLKDLSPALLRSGVVVLAAAQGHIRDKNRGSWAPTLETDRGSSLNRTGALMRSLTVGGAGNVDKLDGNSITVGTNLEANDYSIGRMMQYGTGIYNGGSPITPKNGKFLVFEINGVKIFAKSVKGSPARPFLYIDDQTAQKVLGVFSNYLAGGANASS
jgi:phage gpG-like protein